MSEINDKVVELESRIARFEGAAQNWRVFRPLWHWCMMRLPSLKGGYSLDLDSTELLHEDGHQEGVKIGYTRKGGWRQLLLEGSDSYNSRFLGML